MTAGWQRLRVELRSQWKGSTALMVLIALVGVVVLSSAAAARRADQAIDRFVAFSKPLDVQVIYDTDSATGTMTGDTLADLPQVAAIDEVATVPLALPGPDGQPDLGSVSLLTVLAPTRGAEGTDFERGLVVDGTRADPSDPDSVAIDEILADRLGLKAGDTLPVWSFDAARDDVLDAYELGVAPLLPVGSRIDLHIAAIERRPVDLRPRPDDPNDTIDIGAIYPTAAFYHAYGDSIVHFPLDSANIRLTDASKLGEFEAAVAGLPGGDKASVVAVSGSVDAARKAQRAVHIEVVALVIFACLSALAGILIVGKFLSRQFAAHAESHRVLRTLGMTRGQLIAIGVVKAVAITAPAMLLAWLLAGLLSDFTPIGTARKAEVDAGIRVDWPVFLVGSLAILVVVALLAAVQARRYITRDFVASASLSNRSMPVADTVAGWCNNPVPLVATRFWMGQRRRGPARCPVRSAVFGSVIAVATVAAVVVYTASLDKVLDSPDLQGWNWDAAAGLVLSPDAQHAGEAKLTANPDVDGYSALMESFEPIKVGGADTPAATITRYRGDVVPLLLAGRAPQAPNEIALGFQTLDKRNLHLESQVAVAGDRGEQSYTIVGKVRFWPGEESSLTPGEGALLTSEGLAQVQSKPDQFGFFLVSLTPDADHSAAAARLKSDFGAIVAHPILAEDLVNARQAGSTPTVIAYLVALIALINLAYALVVSVQLRRSEMGTLSVLGFGKRQLRAAVAWETGTVAAIGLLVGLPLGVAIGRWSWSLASRSLQSMTSAEVPAVPLLLIIPITLLLAAACAVVPAALAAHSRPATVLRAE